MIESDYFYSSSPPDLPSVPDRPDIPEFGGDPLGGITDRVFDGVDKYAQWLQNAPTQVDVFGADLGFKLAGHMHSSNRFNGTSSSLHDLCVFLMDATQASDGFSGIVETYNALGFEMARALRNDFQLDPGARTEFYNRVHQQLRGSVNALMRGGNAALVAAWGKVNQVRLRDGSEFTEFGPTIAIVRTTRLPADYL